MTKTLFNLPNILNHRVGLQENYPLSPHHCLISSMASDRQRMQLIYWSSSGTSYWTHLAVQRMLRESINQPVFREAQLIDVENPPYEAANSEL